VIAELLRRLEPDEIPIAVGFLSGAPRQGRIGIGYRLSDRLRNRVRAGGFLVWCRQGTCLAEKRPDRHLSDHGGNDSS
jgi:hypothetical protein